MQKQTAIKSLKAIFGTTEGRTLFFRPSMMALSAIGFIMAASVVMKISIWLIF